MLRLGLIVFIGLSAGCWKHQRTASVPDVVEEEPKEIETSEALANSETKVTPPFRKTDHCYDFTNDTKIYTGKLISIVNFVPSQISPGITHSEINPNQLRPCQQNRDGQTMFTLVGCRCAVDRIEQLLSRSAPSK